MNSLIKLSHEIRELEKEVALCSRCGMCQSVCPVFGQTLHEADVARGKLALLDGIIQEIFDNPKGAIKRLDRCLLCGSCMVSCPNSVPTMELFLKARIAITSVMGLPYFKKTLLKGFLAKPEAFDSLARYGAFFQKLFFRKPDQFHDASCAGLSSIMIPRALASRHVKNPADVPFHKTVLTKLEKVEKIEDKIDNRIKVAFFYGCLTDKIFPEIAESFLYILKRKNIEAVIPVGQGCCGIPALSSGDFETFLALMRLHLELFIDEEFDALVTPCATCTFTIKKLWPLFAENETALKAKVDRLAEKTMDASEFLVSYASIEPLEVNVPVQPGEVKPSPQKITYHDPCHLKKSLKVFKEPRMLLSNYADMEIVEMAGADECCGMGGSFTLSHQELSIEIGSKKAGNIVATGCETVATSCPACMLQIIDMLSRKNLKIKVKHPLEIYANHLKINADQ